MPIDQHLLNKIRSVIALRDKGATDGERDAAQQRLTVLLAKHQLTEQDIPPDNFSMRGRSYSRPRQRRHASDFDAAFEETLRKFREAHFRAGHQRRGERRDDEQARRAQRSGPGNPPKAPSKTNARRRFEATFGGEVTDEAWALVKEAHIKAVRGAQPSNPNAFSRAFYEKAAYVIRDRVEHRDPSTQIHRLKSRNESGMIAGRQFGERTLLDLFLFFTRS